VSEPFFSVSELFLVEDFFGEPDGEAEASALLVELFFVLLEALVPDFLPVVDFLPMEVSWVVVEDEPVVALLFLFAQAVKNAATATTVIKERTDVFIGCG
jgi:hypothetical protein